MACQACQCDQEAARASAVALKRGYHQVSPERSQVVSNALRGWQKAKRQRSCRMEKVTCLYMTTLNTVTKRRVITSKEQEAGKRRKNDTSQVDREIQWRRRCLKMLVRAIGQHDFPG